ncbi:transglycosylase SLT domain-containing protein [bacterium]|nr:transglycosylase SLT domain-containing protein [bacterium]
MDLFKGNGFRVVVIILCLLGGMMFAKLYQPYGKTIRIYKQALKDYNNGNYSNSYYLFSKISHISPLKPIAIYRQAMCARALGDKQSELRRYQQLFMTYPKNKLSSEAKYQAGQLLVEDDPNLALKYFNSVAKSNIDEDYKLATEYYIARLNASKMRYSKKKITLAKFEQIENSYRKYIEEAPDGRLAPNVANSWLKYNPDAKSKDRVLIAGAYYNSKMYKEAKNVLAASRIEDNWAINASLAYKEGDYKKTKELTETGVEKFGDNVSVRDYNRAVDDYLKIFGSDNLKYNMELLSKAKGSKKDYIWNLKCSKVDTNSKYSCYKDLYLNFPNGEYAENAIIQVFKYEIKTKNYARAKDIAKDFIEKFPKSEHIPLCLFWLGKIEQIYYGTGGYTEYFQKVINTYPDTYYAYRAFWILQGLHSATINTELNYKPVEYPYKYPSKNDILYNLITVQDYDMLAKLSKDDFIKSWVEYQKGNYATSLTIARDAMDKLETKPPKTDLRWRLVYPQNFYKQVKNYSDRFKNNDALMMAIIKAESSFNTDAQSSVGAIGLMQLMPSTAHEIGDKHSIKFNTSYLFNPELNIKLGNLYYSTLKEMLDNKEVSAIAAYNGGIGTVTRWKSTLKYTDTDEFVEQIPYEETKNYVEKVFKNYWNYTRIYQK